MLRSNVVACLLLYFVSLLEELTRMLLDKKEPFERLETVFEERIGGLKGSAIEVDKMEIDDEGKVDQVEYDNNAAFGLLHPCFCSGSGNSP